ncbi:phospholipase/carboxylesterase [Frondihabitans sp. PhB188]|uniref:alpha/beta hydrolase n=1 Tax=Frondihabitans sp. PhB188 TaxID=2485200 RepID=UPI000F4AC2B9|nr:dienelactone hydrolase family protein [Frondihabitans sp. PhB188]ROQ37295.1 phospholipase/carboxylesterase [Frondihabitans sp. PhB188]
MVSIDPSAVQWSLPEAERAGKPLVLLLHGVGSHEGDLIGLVPHLSTEFAYASLRAPLSYGGGFSWYPLSQPGAPEYAPVDEAADAVLDFVASLGDAHPAVGLLGFSQGGSLSLQLLRRRPGFFDFAVVLAGFVVPGGTDEVDDAVTASEPAVFYGRGDADAVIPPAAVERTEAWLTAHAPGAELTVYPGLTHGIAQEELDDVNAFLARVHPA